MDGLAIYPLQYSEDLTLHYQALSNLPGFVLLESTDRVRGQYDIVTAFPYDEYVIPRNTHNLQKAWDEFNKKCDISQESSCSLPFQGGAIGYLAYDLGAKLLGIKVPTSLVDNMPLLEMQFYDWAIITDHKAKNVQLVVANQRPETQYVIKDVLMQWHKKNPESLSSHIKQAFGPLIRKEDYKAAFLTIYEDLIRGRAYQVNYTQPFLAHFEGAPWDIYKRIKYQNPVPFSGFLPCRDGFLLSFSPERFLLIENECIVTSPIKGSARRSDQPNTDRALLASLKKSDKNRAENVMIVDLMRNDLGKCAVPGSVIVTSLCEAQSFNGVHHLVSSIAARCAANKTFIDVIAACFPGGSITGAPKREAMRIISEHEPYARGVYCGSIGYFSSHGRFDSSIAIRTMTAHNNNLYLNAGGGIVLDSQWEDEYQECFVKIQAIVKAL